MSYLIYLRKSRADMDAEARGEGETLSRHEGQLLELSKKRGYDIGGIYREIVSGDTIAARPQMQKLIEEVSAGKWEGVIVMEVERLARGDTIDQGMVSQCFMYSGTKIITPNKTYDPRCEADQEYFEFNLFMSRREYKTINRRMQAGRIASVKEGNYIGSQPPYGYRKIRDYERGTFSLEPIPDQAGTIRLMFDKAAEGLGYAKIATLLNDLDIKPQRANVWVTASVKDILSNPVYCGVLRWNHKTQKKIMRDGRLVTVRRKQDDCIYTRGNYPPIITEELFKAAQTAIAARKTPHIKYNSTLQNPFAGVLKCGLCGHVMKRRPYTRTSRVASMICNIPKCPCMASDIPEVERLITAALQKGYKDYTALADSGACETESKNELELVTAEIKKAERQRTKLYDLLEQEIYTAEIFTERSKALSDRLSALRARETELRAKNVPRVPPREAALSIKRVIDDYGSCSTATEKNNLLKTVCEEIIYTKTTGGRWESSNAEITIKYVF